MDSIAIIIIILIILLAMAAFCYWYYVVKKSASTSGSPPLLPTTSTPTTAAEQGWKCINNGDWKIAKRNSSGRIQCYTLGSGNYQCQYFPDQPSCNAAVSKLPPIADGADGTLTCGDQHKQLYGSVGYDDPAHWCYQQRTDV